MPLARNAAVGTEHTGAGDVVPRYKRHYALTGHFSLNRREILFIEITFIDSFNDFSTSEPSGEVNWR